MSQTVVLCSALILLSSGFPFAAQTAQANSSAPKVGKKAAARYFQAQNNTSKSESNQTQRQSQLDEGVENRYPSSIESLGADERFLAVGFSSYMSTDAYNWGRSGKQDGVGKWGLDMTYRISQYNNLLDQALRVSYNEYNPNNTRTSKLSLMYALTLPDAGSQFPLYFGFAAGPGVFFKQLEDESALTLDYQLFLGLRLFNLLENTGFYVEGGLKNHLQLTSDGQLNGSYIGAGAIFTF